MSTALEQEDSFLRSHDQQQILEKGKALPFFSQNWLDHSPEIPVQLFRRFFPASPNPPLYHLHKTSGYMVQQKVLRDIRFLFMVLFYKLRLDQGIQIILKIAQKYLAVLTG